MKYDSKLRTENKKKNFSSLTDIDLVKMQQKNNKVTLFNTFATLYFYIVLLNPNISSDISAFFVGAIKTLLIFTLLYVIFNYFIYKFLKDLYITKKSLSISNLLYSHKNIKQILKTRTITKDNSNFNNIKLEDISDTDIHFIWKLIVGMEQSYDYKVILYTGHVISLLGGIILAYTSDTISASPINSIPITTGLCAFMLIMPLTLFYEFVLKRTEFIFKIRKEKIEKDLMLFYNEGILDDIDYKIIYTNWRHYITNEQY